MNIHYSPREASGDSLLMIKISNISSERKTISTQWNNEIKSVRLDVYKRGTNAQSDVPQEKKFRILGKKERKPITFGIKPIHLFRF